MSKTYEALRKAEAERNAGVSAVAGDAEAIRPKNARTPNAARLEYEKIRVWLKTPAAQGQRLQTVMVIACHSGGGGTTTAGLLASTLARGKKSRVLIMATNFRTPGMNLFFKIQPNGHEPSADNLPFDAKLHPTDRDNLYVLTSDTFSLAALDAFEGEAIDELIAEMRKRFDFIVFDAPPALDFPDAYALASKVDGIIIVVEADGTLIEDAQRAKRDLERAGGRVLGVVLNRHMNFLPTFLRRFVAS